MSGINWKELELLLSEMPLEGSYVQKITEHSVHAFTIHFFSREEKAWMMYTEISTTHTRVNRTEKLRKKSANSQRFTQYLKAHIIGRRVVEVRQYPFDRAFVLKLQNSEDTINMIFRLYSGPGANVIITREDGTILELLFRRPQRGERNGEKLIEEERTNEGKKTWTIRPFTGDSFNAFIDREEEKETKDEKREELSLILKERENREIKALLDKIERLNERIEATRGFEETKHFADLLSANIYMVKKGMTSVTLDDWEKGEKVTISLDPQLSPTENKEKLYSRYRKDKTSLSMAIEEKEKTEALILDTKEKYSYLLSPEAPLEKLRKEVEGKSDDNQKVKEGRPGVWVKSNGWDIIIGRNAKENDEILRSYTRGSDVWMHTRDFSGGYIIIKAQKDRTVPLPVLLDGASLAIHFSKARKNGKADLYYTQVKYLRRVKGGKTGLVLPTQEKNLNATEDEERVRRILGNENEIS
ncbi:MAG: NFACT RNA binding domain-containing protein [Candidatus Ornithospirochaeta sp.]